MSAACGEAKAPAGWWCTRDSGHDGPCAARQMESSPASFDRWAVGSAERVALAKLDVGTATVADLLTLAIAEVLDASDSLPPHCGSIEEGKSGKIEDANHASACTDRAYAFLRLAAEKLPK